MKNWIRRMLFGVLGATVLAGSLAGCAGQRERWREDGGHGFQVRMVERAGRKLDLDAAQKQKLEVLAQKLRAQRQALRGAEDPRAPWRALLAGEKFDQQGAARLLDEKLALVRAGSPELIAAAADFFDHLQPAQQQKVRELLERGPRRGARGG